MSTIHNPTNFEPSDYMVADYLDNHPPVFHHMWGVPPNAFSDIVEQWKAEFIRYYGEDFHRKIHRCVHCGNGNVRYIAVVYHKPSKEYVTFGDICVHRLNFENADEFKAAQVRSRATLEHQRLKTYQIWLQYTTENPEILEANACLEEHEDIHRNNHFAADVLSKLKQYGSLSDRQRDAVIRSLKKDHENAERRVAEENEERGPAPEGRKEVEGEILAIKEVESDFGIFLKMLVKLDNNSKVWCSLPSRSRADRGDRIKFKATFEVSNDDPSFAFGKRPHLIEDIISE